jgi:uncharacterized protein YkwD
LFSKSQNSFLAGFLNQCQETFIIADFLSKTRFFSTFIRKTMKAERFTLRIIMAVFIWIGIAWGTLAGAEEQCPDLSGQDRQSFEYLNQIRSAPAPYALRKGFSRNRLAPTPPLHWNPQLAAVARQKAQSMARYNYFAHVEPNGMGPNRRLVLSGYRLPWDYPLDLRANTVESLASGAPNANEAIDQLLIDQGEPGAGHRVHLLAVASLFRTHTEAGIGIACNPKSKYMYYYVVLTAPPHVWPRIARTTNTSVRFNLRSRFRRSTSYKTRRASFRFYSRGTEVTTRHSQRPRTIS